MPVLNMSDPGWQPDHPISCGIYVTLVALAIGLMIGARAGWLTQPHLLVIVAVAVLLGMLATGIGLAISRPRSAGPA